MSEKYPSDSLDVSSSIFVTSHDKVDSQTMSPYFETTTNNTTKNNVVNEQIKDKTHTTSSVPDFVPSSISSADSQLFEIVDTATNGSIQGGSVEFKEVAKESIEIRNFKPEEHIEVKENYQQDKPNNDEQDKPNISTKIEELIKVRHFEPEKEAEVKKDRRFHIDNSSCESPKMFFSSSCSSSFKPPKSCTSTSSRICKSSSSPFIRSKSSSNKCKSSSSKSSTFKCRSSLDKSSSLRCRRSSDKSSSFKYKKSSSCSSSRNNTSSCTTIDMSSCEVECGSNEDLKKIVDMIRVLNKATCALKMENMKQNKKLAALCERVEQLECRPTSDCNHCPKPDYSSCTDSHNGGCIEDTVKEYIDHQINHKFEHMIEVLDCRFKKLEESIENLQKVVFKKCS